MHMGLFSLLGATSSPPGPRRRRRTQPLLAFLAGLSLGQLYYYYLLKRIPFPYNSSWWLAVVLSVLLGIGNAVSIQIRCISLLILPMYCGKAGRGVLKAVILTYVIAGPITNMDLNAKEVVRVFSCSTQLAHNLSGTKRTLLTAPFRQAMVALKDELGGVKDAVRSIRDTVAPIEQEMEGASELRTLRSGNDYIDRVFSLPSRADSVDDKYRSNQDEDPQEAYLKGYQKKMEYRCENQLSRSAAVCMEKFASAYERCVAASPRRAATVCWPLRVHLICNFIHSVRGGGLCDSRQQIDPGLGEGYVSLKNLRDHLTKGSKDVKLHYKVSSFHELYDVQSAKETGLLVERAFEEKHMIIKKVIVAVNICIALLFLRVVAAAIDYHELYLTCIEHDNVYITEYFKKIDGKRSLKNKYTLLPLKKMERRRYIHADSVSSAVFVRKKLLTQILKVMLEMITATTFVMLDRLFYEALDVVRGHARAEVTQPGAQDLRLEVEGAGVIANVVRRVLSGFGRLGVAWSTVGNEACLPRPRALSPLYYLQIYGGYLWIVLLLYVNPYTLRLKRLICSYFYPRREKQRILCLYNDILKKRLKMSKTLRKKAVQAVRAHYLSEENLLSLRMKYPVLLGWTRVLPASRMACLICGETEPRDNKYQKPEAAWFSCSCPKCPFVYCGECWREVGARCLACDPSLAELSDATLTDDELPAY